jgi:hypothetical protein
VSWAPIPSLPWFTWGVWLFILVTPVQFIGAWSFYKGAWTAIRSRAINMDFLIVLGTSVAYFYSVAVIFFPDVLPVKVEEREVYFEVSAVIIAFVLLGRYMEEIIKKRSSAAVRKLMDLRPAVAYVVRDGCETEVPAESVTAGETLIIRPGERIATDCDVEEGTSSVDESILTGESMPVDKRPGTKVIGGTLNRSGMLRCTATRVGRDTALSVVRVTCRDAPVRADWSTRSVPLRICASAGTKSPVRTRTTSPGTRVCAETACHAWSRRTRAMTCNRLRSADTAAAARCSCRKLRIAFTTRSAKPIHRSAHLCSTKDTSAISSIIHADRPQNFRVKSMRG